METKKFAFSLLSLDSDSVTIERRSSSEETVKYTIYKNTVISLSPKLSPKNILNYTDEIILLVFNGIINNTPPNEIENLTEVYSFSKKISSFWLGEIIQIKNQENNSDNNIFTAYNKRDFETLRRRWSYDGC